VGQAVWPAARSAEPIFSHLLRERFGDATVTQGPSADTRRPLIVALRRGSLEDGPGIRTVVFFKGCPLRCVFCHNPETQEPGPEIAFAEEHCLRCGACVQACPLGAIDLDSPARIDRRRCDRCGLCVEACPGPALRLVGRYWEVGELVRLLLRDAPFYRHSGGGVTLSGGEATMYPDYVESLLRLVKPHGIHVALQTAGHFDYPVFASRILPWVDLIYFDVKFIDRSLSIAHLGRPNDLILENLARLLGQTSVEVRPRIPVIPGLTDSRENLTAIVEHLYRLGAPDVQLLPYNPLGLQTYGRLGRPAPDLSAAFPKPDEERRLVETFREIVGRVLNRCAA